MHRVSLSINGIPANGHIAVARSFFERLLGLMGKRTVYSLLFPSCGSIHTFFMRHAIDAVFLDEQGGILRIIPALAPGRIAFVHGAQSVLEMPAGRAAELSLHTGDRLDFK